MSPPPADHWVTRAHAWARRCAMVAAILATIAVTIAVRQDRHAAPAAAADGIAASAPIPDYVGARLARHRYRHSVIAGGAFTQEELAAAMREDAVVAEHHKAVDIDRVRAIVTDEPRMAYVSYRIGHRVFWTRNPVQIPAGETLLTDGVIEIRGRCGNGVSDVAREPVSDVEPPAAVLDDEEGDSSITGERTLVNTAPVGTSQVPFLPSAQNAVFADAFGDDDRLAPLMTMLDPLWLFPLPTDAADPAGSASDGADPGGSPRDNTTGGGGFGRGGPGTGVSEGGGPGGGGSGDGGPGGGGPGGGGTEGGGSPGGGEETPGGTWPTYPGGENPIDIDPEDPEIHDVPEPGTLALLGLALAVRVVRGRR